MSAAPPATDAGTARARLDGASRLAAVRATGLLDGAADPVLDRLTRMAARLLGVPVAAVTLVDDERQHFPGLTGIDGWVGAARGTPVACSFCRHVVESGAPLVVADVAAHPSLRDGPGCTAPGFRAYAGVPLTTAAGETLGAFCAVDTSPRAWTAGEVEGLRDLAAIAMAEVEMRLALHATPGAAPAPGRDAVPGSADAVLGEIARRGDRWMAAFLGLHALLALVLAPVHDSWRVAVAVIALAVGSFALCLWRRPGSLATGMVAGLALQAFCALHIHQMRGLAEMHFFFFTATTALVIYQDWRVMWPGVLAIVAQHSLFTLWHNAGVHPGGQPFFEPAHVSALKIALHFGIALAQGAVASYWAAVLRRRTLRGVEAHRRLHAQAVALVAQVAARDEAVARLASSEARFRTLSAFSPVGIFETRADGTLAYVNARAQQLWQADEAALLGRGWLEGLHGEDRDAFLAQARETLRAGGELDREFRIAPPGGEPRHVHARVAPLRDAAGAVVGAVGTVEDVTARHRADAALADSERRFRTVVESIDQGLLITDRAGRIVYANTRATEITGRPVDELVGGVASELLLAEEDRAAAGARLGRRLDGKAERYEVELVRKDGSRVWTENGGAPYRDAAGQVIGTIGVVADITARKALEAELTRQAFEDPLTGLANRARFHRRAESTLASAGSGRTPAALLVDLDDFKTVNDSLGHAAGDRLLALVAVRLLDATRGSDTVARLGGDEFAVLLAGVRGEGEARIVADRIVAALSAPFDLEGREIRVGASVGIALAAAAERPEELLRNADLALYSAKAAGKGRCERFVPAMHAAAVERLELEAELRRAVREEELVLHFQPIVDLRAGHTCGVEALVRWRHPERGMVPPAAFIPLAEATGLIVPLGRWVLHEACRFAAAWRDAAWTIAVNVSARQLERPDFVGEVAGALAGSGLAAGRLVLEVTESVLLADLDTALARLDGLRALGVRLALDDFGTGYSSLAYLQRLPVDLLKIDRAFTAGVTAGGRQAALARTILTLAETLGIRTVAEGVETDAQHAELVALGCHMGQGYHYARPLDAATVAAFLGDA